MKAIQELSSWPKWHSFQFNYLQFGMWVHRRLISICRSTSIKGYKILALLSLDMWRWFADLLPRSNISLLQPWVSFYFKGGINSYYRHLFWALQQVKFSSPWENKVSLSLKTLVMYVVCRLSPSETGSIRPRSSKYLYPLPSSWLGDIFSVFKCVTSASTLTFSCCNEMGLEMEGSLPSCLRENEGETEVTVTPNKKKIMFLHTILQKFPLLVAGFFKHLNEVLWILEGIQPLFMKDKQVVARIMKNGV